MCPGADSNRHILANATPSKWCVYQFRHLGFMRFEMLDLRYETNLIFSYLNSHI